MDDSPSVLRKRPNRLSLAKHGKVGDSPKTPCRVVSSPITVNTPPTIRFNGNMHGSYSTPLTHCKRSCFMEESPSQDYDSDPQSLICTQDVRQHIVDVDWKWEEQCANIPKPVNTTKPRRVQSLKLNRPQRQMAKSTVVDSPECQQKRGFFKFKEELMRDLKGRNNDSSSDCGTSTRDSSPMTDFEQDELGSSLKENDNVGVLSSIADLRKNERRKMPQRSKTMLEIKSVGTSSGRLKRSSNEDQNLDNALGRETVTSRWPEMHQVRTRSTGISDVQKTEKPTSIESNLLDDSDVDNLLLQCSQQVEATYNNQVKRKKVEKNDLFVNDSLDDIFLSIPVDEKLLTGVSTVPKQCRSPLIRHHSMPAKSPVLKPVPKCTVNSFTRHNSMPTYDQTPTANTISTSSSKSSSSESVASEKRRCTAEEIERKRQEALQRREASKLKKIHMPSNKSNRVNR